MDDQGDVGTGVVEEALEPLEGLEDRPLEDHLPAYEQAHRALRAALGL